MENNEELNLEQDPIQQEEELELDESTEVDESNSDPLDSIDNVEDAVKEAKKYRSIAKRKSTPEAKPQEETKPSESEFVKKTDLQLSNQKEAIQLATISNESDSEEVVQEKIDILENWDEIRKLYSSRRGKDTSKDILEDIKDAYAIFNKRRPPVEEKEEGEVEKEEITKTEAKVPVGNPPKTQAVKAKNPPNFKLPQQPDEWYP